MRILTKNFEVLIKLVYYLLDDVSKTVLSRIYFQNNLISFIQMNKIFFSITYQKSKSNSHSITLFPNLLNYSTLFINSYVVTKQNEFVGELKRFTNQL